MGRSYSALEKAALCTNVCKPTSQLKTRLRSDIGMTIRLGEGLNS